MFLHFIFTLSSLVSLTLQAQTINNIQLEKTKCTPIKNKNEIETLSNFISPSEQGDRFDDLTKGSLRHNESLLKAMNICAFYTFAGSEKEYKGTFQSSRLPSFAEYAQNKSKYEKMCNIPYKFKRGRNQTLCYSGYTYAIFEEKKEMLQSDVVKAIENKYRLKFKKYQSSATEFGSSESDISEGKNLNIYVQTYHSPSNPRDSITSVIYFVPKLLEWSQVNMKYLVTEFEKNQ